MDGVLLDPQRAGRGHWTLDLFEQHGISPDDLHRTFFERCWPDVVTGVRPLHEALGEALSSMHSAVEAQTVIDCWLKSDFSPIDDAIAVARRAVSAGVRIVLATNQEHLRARYLRSRLSTLFPVDDLVYSAQIGCQKHEERFFRLASPRIHPPATSILFIDDTVGNVECARRAGWPSMWADPDRGWVDDVDHWISDRPRRPNR